MVREAKSISHRPSVQVAKRTPRPAKEEKTIPSTPKILAHLQRKYNYVLPDNQTQQQARKLVYFHFGGSTALDAKYEKEGMNKKDRTVAVKKIMALFDGTKLVPRHDHNPSDSTMPSNPVTWNRSGKKETAINSVH
jgi:hypothetical protein